LGTQKTEEIHEFKFLSGVCMLSRKRGKREIRNPQTVFLMPLMFL
jgi:hypothetical protein